MTLHRFLETSAIAATIAYTGLLAGKTWMLEISIFGYDALNRLTTSSYAQSCHVVWGEG